MKSAKNGALTSLGRTLFPHVQSRIENNLHIHAETCRNASALTIRYSLSGDIADIFIPAPKTPARRDGLWQTTCFEAFFKLPEGSGYIEYNFSPSGEWAAYIFSAYRKNGRTLVLSAPPTLSVTHAPDQLIVEAEICLPAEYAPSLLANLTAVVEEADGTKSYWALAHPDGAPDFHDPACFVLAVGAPDKP